MSKMDKLIIKGARVHNLKNVSLELPKNKLVVFTGLSGSGKTSLAFDTIYAEGQRRYVESLSAYARQFLGVMEKPDVDSIQGLSPAIAINQKSTSHNPRSTVGTITEIYDYLRLLFARVGHPHCPLCHREITRQSTDQIVENALELIKKEAFRNKTSRVLILSPIVRDRRGEFRQLFDQLRQKGFVRVRVDNQIYSLNEELVLLKTNKHTVEAVTDRISVEIKQIKSEVSLANLRSRLAEAVETALNLSEGLVIISQINDASFVFPDKPKKMKDRLFSQMFSCPDCNLSLPEIEPRSFSFNSPHGACPECNGLGDLLKIDPELIVNPRLTISEGGILPFNRLGEASTWWGRILKQLALEDNFSLRIPIKKMKPESLKKVLHGTGSRLIRVKGTDRHGQRFDFETKFEGVIPNLERRFKETESDYIRREIGKYLRKEICPLCRGDRLKKEVLSITIDEKSIAQICQLPIKNLLFWLNSIRNSQSILSEKEKTITEPIFKDLTSRLNFLLAVGLEYLTINRTAESLAGGEAQRIRLASQIGTGLTGILYVLDEPTIGLHQRDNQRLIKTLKTLKNLGNTLIVVEHDREMMESADFLVDFGPGAGDQGGKVIAAGQVSSVKKDSRSLTGQYLTGRKKIELTTRPVKETKRRLILHGCRQFNLKNIDVSFPLGRLICVTGVSGSGKSTLINETLYPALARHFSPLFRGRPGQFSKIEGIEQVDKVLLINQAPIGKTPRSNPATYTNAFKFIRELFSKTAEARIRGYQPGRFSFNLSGGRCESCRGGGEIKIEMQFLADVYVTCDVCHGKRYNHETLEVKYRGKDIAQVLDLSVEEARLFFKNVPGLAFKLETLKDVGLGYLRLGQPAPSLSGGEAQRIKLARELSKTATGKTVYLLDEPTTGLHFEDLKKLLLVLRRLTESGNTVIVVEHNLDVIKNADWIIDLGPEGGNEGGHLVAEGTPAEIAKNQSSWTGRFLAEILK
ncbi:MAG: excinuclease ABC subunit UvrA [Candidatus Pacebacteria bacterium]|nr:excinuclease ABC subunit UvrA [Candidatus Paceibacterota bacterium]